jgi:hypothetical protein
LAYAGAAGIRDPDMSAAPRPDAMISFLVGLTFLLDFSLNTDGSDFMFITRTPL